MVRLTADLVLESPQHFNPIREREIDLRGQKIAAIENLGATEDLFDAIDLSDNEISKLEGFPLLKRLTTLLLSNNRISRISHQLGKQLPRLQTLVLTNNRLQNLSELDPLASLASSLTTLSLLDNIVTKKPKYRPYVIQLLPKLKLLDFRKVKPKEREEAAALLEDQKAAADARRESANTFVPGEALEPGRAGQEGQEKKDGGAEGEAPEAMAVEVPKPPTAEQLTAIKAAIATAQTLEEVARLEKALQAGQMPEELSGDKTAAA